MHLNATPPTRLFFLDWLRILAFFLLIVFHVGMYYVSWDWHVKSVDASPAAEPFMLLSSPWRLDLLFLVSGVASGYMLTRAPVARFLRQRSMRLLVPLLFGMLVIVPPQPWLEVVEKLGYQGSYADFMRRYLSGYGGFCKEECLTLPTWNHLWFVAYLWVYTLALAALAALMGARFDRLAQRIATLLTGWRIVALPVAALALLRIALIQRFPPDHSLVNDWYNHATYFLLFLLGALLARTPQFWPRLPALRWPCLGMAVVAWCAIVAWHVLPESAVPPAQVDAWRALMRTVYVTLAWCAMVAAMGFAHRHLNVDSPARRYLTEAVFPVYIVHQTLIVVLAHSFKPLRLAPGLEAVMLIALTTAASFGIFEAVRRSSLLRPLFGLARRPRGALQGPQPAVAAGARA